MTRLLRAIAIVAPLLATACATAPAQQIEVSGALPPAGPYALVRPDDASGLNATLGETKACLANLGYEEGHSGLTLVQVAHGVRPARSRLIRGSGEPGRGGRHVNARRDQEDLTLAFSDAGTGALVWRAAVTRRLGKDESAGDGSRLVPALCGAIKDARAATTH